VTVYLRKRQLRACVPLDGGDRPRTWKYDPQIRRPMARSSCASRQPSCLGAYDGRIMWSADGWLHALDARNRHLYGKSTRSSFSREARALPPPRPLLAVDLTSSHSGGDFAGAPATHCIRSEYRRAARRFFTVPRNPARGPRIRYHLKTANRDLGTRHRWDACSGAPSGTECPRSSAATSCTWAPPMRRRTTPHRRPARRR